MRAAGRRPPGLCSRRGACPAGCTPHFLFGLGRKENGPCTVQKKRPLGALRCSGPPRDGGRRIGACSDFAWPSGTLSSSARSMVPSRAGWCGGRRGARTHLTCFSFRAFRFATRCPGGRRGRCPHRPVAEAFINHRASGSENRRKMYPCTSPGRRFPQGPGVSVPDRRAGPPTIPRRRQEVRAGADRPAEHFFFSTGRGAFSF